MGANRSCVQRCVRWESSARIWHGRRCVALDVAESIEGRCLILPMENLPPEFRALVPGTYEYRKARYRRKRLSFYGVSIGVCAVSILITVNPSGIFSWHTVCVNETRLGNVTAWTPLAVQDVPYHGITNMSFSVWWPQGWVRSTPYEFQGNATAYFVFPDNWTIYSVANVAEPGPGPTLACPSLTVAELSRSSSPVGGVLWTPLAAPEVQDTDIPTQFNASSYCTQYDDAPPGCAVSAMFNVNYVPPGIGQIDTCGLLQQETLGFVGSPTLLKIPFQSAGGVQYVMADFNDAFAGSAVSYTIWENYTFPANGGIWNYSYVLGSPTVTGTELPVGLAFSYTPCP